MKPPTTDSIRRSLRRIMALVAVLTLSGCFGGPMPAEKYLRLSLEPQATQESAAQAHAAPVVIAIKNFTSLAALDRPAVLFADGSVLSPNSYWYWEGTPAEVVAEILADALNRSPAYTVVWPYTARIEHHVRLSGRIQSFEVQTRGDNTFTLGMRLDVWGPRGKDWIAGKDFHASAPLAGTDAGDVAEAARQALGTAVGEATAWLQGEPAVLAMGK